MKKYNYMKLVDYLVENNSQEIELTLNEIPKNYSNPRSWYKGTNVRKELFEKIIQSKE